MNKCPCDLDDDTGYEPDPGTEVQLTFIEPQSHPPPWDIIMLIAQVCKSGGYIVTAVS